MRPDQMVGTSISDHNHGSFEPRWNRGQVAGVVGHEREIAGATSPDRVRQYAAQFADA